MNTQQRAIITYLSDGRTLTVAKALSQLGVYALSQRVGELKAQRWPIESRWLELPNGKRVKEYFLRVPEQQQLEVA